MVDDVVRLAHLHDASQVHDRDAVREVPRRGQVVGDVEVGEPEVPLNVLHHVEDLRPGGQVDHGDGLVRDQHGRVQDEGPGRGHPLALAPGEHVGEAAHEILGRREFDLRQGPDDPGFAFLSVRGDFVDLQGFLQDVPDLEPGIHGGVGILEDHLDLPPVLLRFLVSDGGDVPAVEEDPAARGVDQLHDELARRGLARAGFPDQAEDLPPADLKGDPVHRTDDLPNLAEGLEKALVGGEVFLEVVHPQDDVPVDSVAHSKHLQQAARWPGSISRTGGSSIRHRS